MRTIALRPRRPARALLRDRGAIAMTEFALALPLFIGLMACGLEAAQLMLATVRVQRLATMTADMIARTGSSEEQITEAQVYDTMLAMDLAARPLNIREDGRVIISAVLGEDTNNDGTVDVNRIRWQRFDGQYVAAAPVLGCMEDGTVAVLPNNRRLALAEPLFHVQVSYRYTPLIGAGLVRWFGIPDTITRVASFRGRGAVFRGVLSVEGYPPKSNCDSPTGL